MVCLYKITGKHSLSNITFIIEELKRMEAYKKKLMAAGLALSMVFGGLTACGDGVDQDNGPSDGEEQDEMDEENED
jgi:hypothetical protein